jgi:uncharacterized OB-fold protein
MGEPRPIHDGLFLVEHGTARLVVGRCTTCRDLHFPREEVCPYCGAAAEACHVGPRATLRLFTVVRSAPPGYRGPIPYGFGAAELDGTGLCVLGRLTEADADRLRIGQPLTLVVEPLFTDDAGQQVLSWAFAPEGA